MGLWIESPTRCRVALSQSLTAKLSALGAARTALRSSDRLGCRSVAAKPSAPTQEASVSDVKLTPDQATRLVKTLRAGRVLNVTADFNSNDYAELKVPGELVMAALAKELAALIVEAVTPGWLVSEYADGRTKWNLSVFVAAPKDIIDASAALGGERE